MSPVNYLAYTAPINPDGAVPVLTSSQVWAGLQHKIRDAKAFVGGAITSVDVTSTSTDAMGRVVVEREVVFAEGNRRVKERCTEFPGMKVEFAQPDGSTVLNVISEGPGGEEAGDLWLTYTFEWVHSDFSAEQLAEKKKAEKNMAKMAVESTIKVLREMVVEGRLK